MHVQNPQCSGQGRKTGKQRWGEGRDRAGEQTETQKVSTEMAPRTMSQARSG